MRRRSPLVLTGKGAGMSLLDDRKLKTTIVIEHANGQSDPPLTSLEDATHQSDYLSGLDRVVLRSTMIDANNWRPRPPRRVYSKAEKRLLRRMGAWPPYTYRSPWQHRSAMVDGDCFHTTERRGNADAVVLIEPMPSVREYEHRPGYGDTMYVREERTGTIRLLCGDYVSAEAMPPALYDPLASCTSVEAALNRCRRKAFAAALPQLSNGFAGVLFLKEMGDVRKLYDKARVILKWVFTRHGWTCLRALLEYVLAKLRGKTVANEYLLVQFGLLPLVGDLIKLFDTLMHGAWRIRKLLNDQQRLLVVHGQEAVVLPRDVLGTGIVSLDFDTTETAFLGLSAWDPAFPSGQTIKLFGSSVPWEDRLVPRSSKYHLTLRYRLSIPNLPGGCEAFLLALDALGLNLSASQLWQAIPFSFLVDWFAPVSEWLSDTVPNVISVRIDFDSFVESVKYRYTRKALPHVMWGTGALTVSGPAVSADPWRVSTLGSSSVLANGRVYKRWAGKGIPSYFSAQRTLPSGMKWLSATALLYQVTH